MLQVPDVVLQGAHSPSCPLSATLPLAGKPLLFSTWQVGRYGRCSNDYRLQTQVAQVAEAKARETALKTVVAMRTGSILYFTLYFT